MRIRVLGSAAGGGFPQWNCICSNCGRFRRGTLKGKARSQTQLAIGINDRWLLLDASPDLRWQIEATPGLTPKPSNPDQTRQTPILGVVLTCADLDRVLGILLLREFQPFTIYATASVRRVLTEDNSMFRMLHRLERQVLWQPIAPGETFEVAGIPEVRCEPIAVPASYPEYVSSKRLSQLKRDEAVIGLRVEETNTGRKMLYCPSLPQIDNALLKSISGCDLLFADATFWENEELIQIRGNRTAKEMGHIPVSGPEGSMERLQTMERPQKVYLHINNTNPILDEESAAFAEVHARGWRVAEDGMEFEL